MTTEAHVSYRDEQFFTSLDQYWSMGLQTQVSKCGNFVAAKRAQHVSIYSLLEPIDPNFIAPIHYDLSIIFNRHRKLRGWPSLKSQITISIFKWELILSKVSTKVAVCASDGELNLIVILLLNGDDPILIEADPLGVERLEWLPFFTKEANAYSNSTLLVVFTKLNLDLRVYSIVHTNMLFCVPTPLIKKTLPCPDDSGIWTVVVTPYYEKKTSHLIARNDPASTWPTLLHFHTDGIMCSLMASLKLDFDPSYNSTFSWSRSGKWLMYFDTFHSLDSPKLLIFNKLGIHDKPVEDLSCHVAQPTRTLSFDQTSGSSSDLYPSCMWGQIQSIEYIVITPTSTTTTLSLRVSDISGMFKLQRHNLALTSGQIWLQPGLSTTNTHYKSVSHLPNSLKLMWSKTLSFGSSHLLAAKGCVVIFRAVLDVILSFNIVSVLCVHSDFLDAKELADGSHVLAFSDHIVLCRPNGMKIIVSTGTHFSDLSLIEREDTLLISFVKRESGTLVWKQVKYRITDNEESTTKVKPVAALVIDDTNISANPLVGGMNGSSIFGDIRREHSSSPSPIEEITDTFHAQKRRKA